MPGEYFLEQLERESQWPGTSAKDGLLNQKYDQNNKFDDGKMP